MKFFIQLHVTGPQSQFFEYEHSEDDYEDDYENDYEDDYECDHEDEDCDYY